MALNDVSSENAATMPTSPSQTSSADSLSWNELVMQKPGYIDTPRSPANLCATCKGIFTSPHLENPDAKWHDYHADLSKLHASAASGCDVCERVRVHISRRPDGSASVREPITGALEIGYKLEQTIFGRLSFEVGWAGYWVFDQILVREPDELGELDDNGNDHDDDAEDIVAMITKSKLAHYTLSDDTWELAAHWLHVCKTDHELCQRYAGDIYIPQRVVSATKQGPDLVLRLCRGSSLPYNTPYVTLSHCWGVEAVFSLTTDNETALMESIPWSKIPQIFRDAALATCELGFRFIWIDSLCIMQDAASDWTQQSSFMGQIYKSAALNIAGTGFADGVSGLFTPRDPSQLLPLKIEVNWPGGVSTGSETQRNDRKSLYHLVDDLAFRREVEEAPLNRRGWVVQERLLSPRILHFGANQMFWECCETTRCETFPDQRPRAVNMVSRLKQTSDGLPVLEDFKVAKWAIPRGLLHQSRSSFEGSNLNALEMKAKVKAYDAWAFIVETYSLGALTIAEDKLPAISGIAKDLKTLLDDEYLAGLWRGNLHRELLWSRAILKTAKIALPLQYRAPTWSWASLDGAIDCLHKENNDEDVQQFHCSVLEASVIPLTDDITGPVGAGYLRVQGPLFVAQMDGTHWVVTTQKLKIQVTMDYVSPGYNVVEVSRLALVEPRRNAVTVSMSHKYEYQLEQTAQVFLFTVLEDMHSHSGQTFTAGLILIPLAGERGRYTRIGMFECHDEWQEMLHTNPEILPAQCYEESDWSGKYTITIF